MKALIVYDSFFGNTEQVANAICGAIGSRGEVDAIRVDQVTPAHLVGLELLIVGSPTRAFQPSEKIKKFLKSMPPRSLDGVKVAAFDTRIAPEDTGSAILRFMVGIFGYAARPIADNLVKHGGTQAISAEGFVVKGTEGPLKDGELERAAGWANSVITG